VILLTERVAELRYPPAELRRMVEADVYGARAGVLLEQLLERAAQGTPVEVSRSFGDLSARITP
jgi:hypothetical protein